MRNKVVWAAVGLVIIGVLLFSVYERRSTTGSSSNFQHAYSLMYKTASNTFYCSVAMYTESNCLLFAGDADGKNLTDLNTNVDYGDFEKKIQLSPDKKNLLVVLEHQAISIDTATLEKKLLLQAPAGEVFGTYDAFPAFIPYAKWLNNTQIQVSLFKQDTPEPNVNEPGPVPEEVRTISIE